MNKSTIYPHPSITDSGGVSVWSVVAPIAKLTLVCALWLSSIPAIADPFNPGNLVVVQAAASANNTTVSVIELDTTTPAQTAVQTIPILGTGTNAIRVSGSATSTCYVATTNDGSLVTFTGANSTETGVNANTLLSRAVVALDPNGNIALATTYTGLSGQQTRGATSVDNSTWFIGDQRGLYTNGTSSASTGTTANLRSVKSFGGTVYCLQASSTVTVIQVSTIATPTATTVTGLPGLTNNSSAQDFYLISSGENGSTFDVLYVISATSNTAGSITKYSLVEGSWVANGSYTTTFGGFGIVAVDGGNGALLYATTGQGALTANSVLKLADTAGFNAAINITTANNVTLYTAPTGTINKGIAFAPASSAPGVLALSAPTYSVNEAGSTATITVNRTSGSSGTVTVDYATSSVAPGPGIATAGADYSAASGTLTFLNGETTKTFTVAITEDASAEGDETFNVTLSNPTGATLGTQTAAVVTIVDNDNGGMLLFSATNYPVNESVSTATITVSRTVGTTGTVTLNYATSDGTATQPDDYTAASGTLTFLNGETSKTFEVTLINDSTNEPSETVNLTLSNVAGGTIGTPSTATITIENDDPPDVVPSGIKLNEIFVNVPGNDNGQEFIELRSTTNGVEAMTGLKLLIIEGDTEPGVIDQILDLGTFSTGTNGLFLWRDGASVIDPAPDAATTIHVADISPDIENGSNTYMIVSGFTGSLNQDLDANNDGVLDVTPWASVVDAVGFLENDVAVNVVYAAGLGFINIGPDATYNADALVWYSPTNSWRAMDVVGTNPGGPYTPDFPRANFLVGDGGTTQLTPGSPNASNSPGVLALSTATYTTSEGAGNVTITVSRTGGSTGTVTIDYATSDGTALQPGDYTQASGTLTFLTGEISKTFAVPVIENGISEPDETFTVTLSNVTGGATVGTNSSAVVTIQDNDNGGVFQFASANFPASEAVATATITVSRTGGTTGAVSVDYATSNGTAAQPGDYTSTNGTLNFADGEASKTFEVTVINDSDIETAETVNLTLSAPVGGTLGAQTTATLTITSDDAPLVLLNEISVNQPGTDNPYEYIELKGTPGASLDGIYVVSLEGERSSGTSTLGGFADRVFDMTGQVLGSNGLLMIKATNGGHTPDPATTVVTSTALEITAGGALENGSNSFALIHSPLAPVVQATDLDTNDDGTLDALPAGAVLVDAVGYSDGGFHIVLGGVTVTQVSGTPDALTRFPTDNTPLSSAAWYNGDLSGTLTTTLEYNATIASANFPIGGSLTPGAPNSPSAGGVLAFSSATFSAGESALEAVLTVTRTSGSLGTITVDYATANGTAIAPGDYTSTTGTLTFLENELSKTITLVVNNDGTPETPEDFTVTLSNPTGTNASLGIITTATVSVQDSAGALQFASSGFNFSESGGTVTIQVTRTNGTTGSVTVDYATSAGTATAGSDYTETTGTLTLGNGVASGSFDIPILNDGDIEAAETVTITLSNPTVGAVLGTPSVATLLITDDDGQFVRLNELKVNPPTGADLPNEFIEIKGTPSATLNSIYVISMDGNVGADLGKAEHVFDLNGQTVGTNGLILIKSNTDGPTAAPGTTIFASAALDVGSIKGLENDTSSYLVIYSPTNPIVLGTDYDSNDDGVLDLPAGAVVLDAVGWRDGGVTDLVYGGVTLTQTNGTPDVATRFPDNDTAFSATAWYNGDLLFGSVDPTEIQYDINPLFLSANFPSGGLLTPGDTNAPKPGAFSVASATYSVDEGAVILSVTVNRVGGLTGAATVDYATANGTAIQPADYISASGTLTFADGETSQSIDLFVEEDSIVELDETFSFTLSNPTGGATLGTNPVSSISIQDNDGAGIVSLDQSTFSILEGAGTLSITVNRFGGTGEPFTVNYATSAGTATAGTDYTETSGTLSFAQDEIFKTIDIPIISDSLSEAGETFTLTLSGITGTAVLDTPSSAVITIASDDPPALVLNEIKINPAGSPDEPYEYVEIRGNPGETLPLGTMFVVFEGDSGASLGFADIVIDLGGQTLGSNGLLIMKSSTGGHAVPPETTVVTDPLFTLSGGGFENGTGTFALWFSPSAPFIEGTDYDSDNNGTQEPPVGAILLDTIGISDGGASDLVYGGIVLTQSSGTPDSATRFPGNTTPIALSAWYNADLIGTNADVTYDATKASANFPIDGILTPGAPNIGTPPPDVEIAVFDGAAITDPELTDGQAGVVAFGSTPVGTPVTRNFTIQNTGTEAMTITGIAVPTGFTALIPPSSVAAGSTATFQVRFDATSAATATGSVAISSTDLNENPFNFPVSATATSMLTHQQDWRQTYFGNSANSGDGADSNDFDKDGLVNLIEYALGTNPTLAGSSAQLPLPNFSGGSLTLTVTQPTGVTGITYAAEYSTSLNPTEWSPVTGVFNSPVHTFSQPVGVNTRMFMRLVITNITD